MRKTLALISPSLTSSSYCYKEIFCVGVSLLMDLAIISRQSNDDSGSSSSSGSSGGGSGGGGACKWELQPFTAIGHQHREMPVYKWARVYIYWGCVVTKLY